MADRVGVYDILGSVLSCPGPRASAGVAQTASLSQRTQDTGVSTVISETLSSQHEVTRLNAILSGSERFESGSTIEFSYTTSSGQVPTWGPVGSYSSWAEKKLYYAKGERISGSFTSWSVSPSFWLVSPPMTAPLSSSEFSAALADAGATGSGIQSFMSKVGTVKTASDDFLLTEDWSGSLYLGTGSLTGASQIVGNASTTIFFSASQANIIRVNGEYAIITGSGYVGSELTFYYAWSGDTKLCTAGFAPSEGDTIEFASWVKLSSSEQGVFLNNTVYDPSVIPIQIDANGAIRDIKFWIEFLHDCRLSSTEDTGLQSVAISARSPNVSFNSAHPSWNDTTMQNVSVNADANAGVGASPSVISKFTSIPNLEKGSYLLWSGHKTQPSLSSSFPSTSMTGVSLNFREFDRDIDMRTVFWDGSSNANPRDISVLLPSASQAGAGVPESSSSLTSTLRYAYTSPTSLLIDKYIEYGGLNLLPADLSSAIAPSGSLTCSAVPWMYDDSLSQNGIVSGNMDHLLASGTVPTGWSGSAKQIGPENIRPVYPILDDIYGVKISTEENSLNPFQWGTNTQRVEGFRPGLRGTEINGEWQIMFGTSFSQFISGGLWYGYTSPSSSGIWLKDIKIEALLDSPSLPYSFIPSGEMRTRKRAKARRNGSHKISVNSGSSNWDQGVIMNFDVQGDEFGRTVSITSDTGSREPYAVMSYITGTLLTNLSGNIPSWFLSGNGFGTPFIPDSSQSLGPTTDPDAELSASNEILRIATGITPEIPGSNFMQSYLSRIDYTKTAVDAVNAVLSSGSSSL